MLREFAVEYPLGIEMGRFLAASCGKYYTQVKDLKSTGDANYAILDGGIHHLNYFGQRMAMQVPPISIYRAAGVELTQLPAVAPLMEYLIIDFSLELLDSQLHIGIDEFRLGEELPESLLNRRIDVVNGLLHSVDDIIIGHIVGRDD